MDDCPGFTTHLFNSETLFSYSNGEKVDKQIIFEQFSNLTFFKVLFIFFVKYFSRLITL
jgi:hypothetical protein